MGGGAHQAGQQHVGVLHILAGVGDVVGVHRVDGADQFHQVRASLEETAQDVGLVQLRAHDGVRRVGLQPVGELRLRRSRLQRGGHPALRVAGGVGALAARLGQDLLGLPSAGGPRVDEGARLRRFPARVASRRSGRVVPVGGLVVRRHLSVVRIHRSPAVLLRGAVGVDRRLRLPLRPAHRVRVRLQRLGRRLAGVGRRQPLLGMHVELLAEGVRRLALPALAVQRAHPLADALERPGEIPQMPGPCLQCLRAAVDQLLGVLALSQPALGDIAAQPVVHPLPEVTHPFGRAVRADRRQAVRRLVRAPVDGLPDARAHAVDSALQAVPEVVDHVPQAHQRSTSPNAEASGPSGCQSVRESNGASGVTVEVSRSSFACAQACRAAWSPACRDSAL